MKKIIKKNQLTILVMALMLITAGYLNYNSNTAVSTGTEIATIGDATLVSSNISDSINEQEENTIEETSETDSSSISTEEENTLETDSKNTNVSEYFSSSRLDRETMYSQMLESYQKILDSSTISEKQKEAAQVEINNINKTKNSIMICENLIKTKGFNDVVIFLNDDSISAVINKDELNKEDIAQIESIIAREMNVKIEDIHIMNK